MVDVDLMARAAYKAVYRWQRPGLPEERWEEAWDGLPDEPDGMSALGLPRAKETFRVLVRAVLEAVGLRTPGYPTAERQWVVALYRYHRDNLLFLLNAVGYGAPAVAPFHVMNTGDWVGEIALMLADDDGSVVARKANIDREELRRRIDVWVETEVKPAVLKALGLPECGLPRPGQQVYVPTSAYIDSPWRDVEGGLATVDRVEIRDCPNPRNAVFVGLRELPGRMYNWCYLAENQDRWAREYAGRRARPAGRTGPGVGVRLEEGTASGPECEGGDVVGRR